MDTSIPASLSEQTVEDVEHDFDVFAFGSEGVDKLRCKQFTREKYVQYVDMVMAFSNSKDGKDANGQATYKRFQKAHYYKAIKTYKLRKASGHPEKFLLCGMKDGLPVVPMNEMYKKISRCHDAVSHAGIAPTYHYAKERYHNVTKELVSLFCQLCPTCQKKNNVIETPHMINPFSPPKPTLRSQRFRDRFQVDLIDMQDDPQINHNGVRMIYILMLKDHFSQFTYLAALPNDESKVIAYEVERICCFLGFPFIFQIGDGYTINAQEVLQELQRLHPGTQIIQGRDRGPGDEVTVNNTMNEIRALLSSFSKRARASGKQPNWTSLLGRTMTSLNTTIRTIEGDTRQKRSPRDIVFGSSFQSTREIVFGPTFQDP